MNISIHYESGRKEGPERKEFTVTATFIDDHTDIRQALVAITNILAHSDPDAEAVWNVALIPELER